MSASNPASEGVTEGDSPVQNRLAWAKEIALEAGRLTLKYFRNKDLGVDRKGDGSPVTIADRQAEELLRERIAERFPEDAILGEEFPVKEGTSGYRWVLDPIDGTKAFIHGVPLYTTLIAVLEESTEEPILGVIHAPATGESIHAAVGCGAWYQNGENELVQAQVSEVSSLSEGLFLTSSAKGFQSRSSTGAEVYKTLQNSARISRTWGDAYGYMMVAVGRAELMIDAEMSLWDAAVLKPILEEAGGSFTSWDGTPTVHAGEGIGTNGKVLDEVLAVTKGH